MSVTTRPRQIVRQPTAPTRVGFGIAIAVNIALLFVVNNLLRWGWVPFLTDDFERVLPLLNLSLTAAVVVNLAYISFSPPWFRSVGQIALNAISLAVTIRIYQVFPFDFAAYEFAWSSVARTILVIAMVGIVVGAIAEFGRLASRITEAD
ncbi:MAG: hypothetical protein OEO77_13185 [Acidimicrobiia bacterium]|nr:hypothetical protein [Acidimicrobiia bacterium]